MLIKVEIETLFIKRKECSRHFTYKVIKDPHFDSIPKLFYSLFHNSQPLSRVHVHGKVL